MPSVNDDDTVVADDGFTFVVIQVPSDVDMTLADSWIELAPHLAIQAETWGDERIVNLTFPDGFPDPIDLERPIDNEDG